MKTLFLQRFIIGNVYITHCITSLSLGEIPDILVCYGINTWNGSGSDSTWMRVVYLSRSSLTGSGSIGSIESCPLQISGYRPQSCLISQDIPRIMQDIPYLITILMGITES